MASTLLQYYSVSTRRQHFLSTEAESPQSSLSEQDCEGQSSHDGVSCLSNVYVTFSGVVYIDREFMRQGSLCVCQVLTQDMGWWKNLIVLWSRRRRSGWQDRCFSLQTAVSHCKYTGGWEEWRRSLSAHGLLERMLWIQWISGDETYRYCSCLISWWIWIVLKEELKSIKRGLA